LEKEDELNKEDTEMEEECYNCPKNHGLYQFIITDDGYDYTCEKCKTKQNIN